MLTIENVTKKYKNFAALSNVNLELKEGIYGLLSPNGAGKTTLLKMIATMMPTTEGNIYYDGKNIMEMGESYRELLGYMPQKFGYYKDYSAVRYLSYLAALKGLKKGETAEKIDELMETVGLAEVKNQKLKTYSGGMIQRVGIVQALLGNPKILILDEPTAGLDPKERANFRDLLLKFSEGKIILYSTHIVSDIESIADRIIMLRDHTLYCDQTVEELKRSFSGTKENPNLEDIFLEIYG